MAAYRPVSTTVSEHSRFKIQGSPSLQPALPDMDRKGKLILLKKVRLRFLRWREPLADPTAPPVPLFLLLRPLGSRNSSVLTLVGR